MLLALFATGTAAQQACYHAAGQKTSSNIIPCGSGSGVASCCQVGDFCLEDSACWNEVSDLTYLYGCTDPTYTDVNCPWKCGTDFTGAPYVGLTPCFNSTQYNWVCTSPPNNGSAIVGYPPPACLGDDIIAFAGASTLPPVVSLPANTKQTSLWFSSINATAYRTVDGFTPSTTPTPSVSRPVSVEYLSHSPTPTAPYTSSTTSQTASHLSGLSPGAKIGIGVGIGIGVPLATMALVVGVLSFRKRKPIAKEPEEHEELSVTDFGHPKKRNLSELSSQMRDSSLVELPIEGVRSQPLEMPDNGMEAELSVTKSPYLLGTQGDPTIHEMPAENSR